MDAPDDSGSFIDAASARAYLNSLSAHQARKGDTSFLHPDFAIRLANSVKQARDAGLPVTLQSGYREPGATGSNYDAQGYSLHGYGAATDIGGIGSAGSPQAKQWAQIAQANGIYNPYGVGNPKEFNHWQLVPYKLEARPDVQAALVSAKGDANKVWNAIAPVSTGSAMAYSGAAKAPASAAIDNAADPFKEYPGASARPAKAPVADIDPFKEYPTAPSVSAAKPVDAAPAPKDSDPFSEYPTTSKASAPSPAAPVAPIGVNDSVRAAASGVPIIGGLLNKADAATNATLAPVLNRFFSPGDQLQGETWSDRYKNSLATQEGTDKKFATDHPYASTALKIGGAIAGTAPAMLAAPAAFGAAEGAPLAVNALAGAATGAGIGAADSLTRDGLSVGNAEKGAFWGGLGGAAGPVIGAGVSRAVRNVSNMLNRTSPEAVNFANMFRDAGMTPEEAAARRASLGPNAVLADIHPLMAEEAQGIASKGGAPTSILKSFAAGRSGEADNRIEDAATKILGSRPDLTASKTAIEDAASAAAKPHYDAARASPSPMDATPVLQYIDGELANAKGGVAKTLQMARNLVTKPSDLPGVTVPEDSAQGLLAARQALDDFINRAGDAETTAGKNALRQASAVRQKIDELVKADPNIAAGDKAFSSRIAATKDLEGGNSIFSPSTRLEDFQRAVKAASADPERLAAMQKGALAAIHDRLGGVSGDYAAARNIFGKGSINRAKLSALFPDADAFLNSLESEIAQRGTDSAIRAGSQTANKLSVARKYSPSSGTPGDATAAIAGNAFGGPMGGVAAAGAKALYGGLSNAFTAAALKRLTEGTARGLVATGPEQEALMAQIARAYKAQPTTEGAANLGGFGANLLSREPVQRGFRAKLEEAPLRQ